MPLKKEDRVVNTDNIQGSIWPRLPKSYESYLFFKITDKQKFRNDLHAIIDEEITTGSQCEKYLTSIGELEEASDTWRKAHPNPEPFTAVNIAFTHPGLLKVEPPEVQEKFAKRKADDPDAYCTERINEGLFEKGMFLDLTTEGADYYDLLDQNFKPPDRSNASIKDDTERWAWRTDGVFIVAAHSPKTLRNKIGDLVDAFNADDANTRSMKIAFQRDGQLRPGDSRGKEHFGWEDHISQPKIQGLDEPPAKGEPHACKPGYIFLGHKGDPNLRRPTKPPAWAKEGSFFVFRQLDQRVPEFENFLQETAPKIPGTNYQGEGGPEKLGAHLMGRWKSGAPVAKAVDRDDPDLAWDNKFDYRPNQSIKGCPFSAHTRKMRPRSDEKAAVGTEEEGDETPLPEPEDSDQSEAEGQEESPNVILRRGISFGPELTEQEKKEKKTIEHRGILFTCYQSIIRDGFNFLMTRWASNENFPKYKTKTFPEGVGMDAFVHQKNRPDHPNGHVALYDGKNDKHTVKVELGIQPWVDQRGGEYFFTPSIQALKEQFSTARA